MLLPSSALSSVVSEEETTVMGEEVSTYWQEELLKKARIATMIYNKANSCKLNFLSMYNNVVILYRYWVLFVVLFFPKKSHLLPHPPPPPPPHQLYALTFHLNLLFYEFCPSNLSCLVGTHANILPCSSIKAATFNRWQGVKGSVWHSLWQLWAVLLFSSQGTKIINYRKKES